MGKTEDLNQNTKQITQNLKSLKNDSSSLDVTFNKSGTNLTESIVEPNQIIGNRYRIIKLLGQGGMGVVYKAFDLSLKINIAIKFIRTHYFKNNSMIEKFKNEILLARSISHPNVIQIYEFEQYNKLIFITMQYIEGYSLKDIIQKHGALKYSQTTKYAIQILKGLKAAHQLNIIHNDLKPHNIIIDKNERVYVADFGLSFLLKKGETLEPNKNFIGTPKYISPEQWTQGISTFKSDIYSFGILLFEMLTGVDPFIAQTVFEMVNKHLNEKPVFPEALEGEIPIYFKNIVFECLKKEHQERTIGIDTIIESLKTKSNIKTKKTAKSKFFLIPLILLLCIAFILFHNYRVSEPKTNAFNATPRIKIAIIPFSKNFNDFDKISWGPVVSNMLNADLEQSKFLTPEHLNSLEYTKNRRFDYLIIGNYSLNSSNNFKVNLKILDFESKDELYQLTEYCNGIENISLIVDNLSPKIKTRLKLSNKDLREDYDKKIRDITSSSPNALFHFYNAQRYMEESKPLTSIKELLKALTFDYNFPHAHWLLQVAYYRTGNFDKAKKHMNLALNYSSKLPLKERLKMKADYQFNTLLDTQQAIKTYKTLHDSFPEDIDIILNLAGSYRLNREWAKAQAVYQKVNPADSFLSVRNIVQLLIDQQKYQEAIDYLKSNKYFYEDKPQYHRTRTFPLIYLNKLEEALSEINSALEYAPYDKTSQLLKGQVLFFSNQINNSRSIFSDLIMTSEPYPVFDSYLMSAYLHLHEENHEQYLKTLAAAKSFLKNHTLPDLNHILDIHLACYYIFNQMPLKAVSLLNLNLKDKSHLNINDHLLDIYFYLGLAYLKTDQIKSAEETSQKLKTICSMLYKDKFKYYHLLNGNILLAKNEYSLSLKEIKKAISFITIGFQFKDTILFFKSIVDLYLKTGDAAMAVKYFHKIINLKFGRMYFPYLYSEAKQKLLELSKDQ